MRTPPPNVLRALRAVLVLGCVAALAPAHAGAASSRSARVSADDPVDYVVAISVDGLNPAAIRRLGRSGAPHLHALIAGGATTLNARTEYERTITLPNHTGMVTGRKIAGRGGHHVTVNDDTGSTVHRYAGGYVRSMFDVVHDHGGSTAFYSAKHKFDLLNRTWDAGHGATDGVGRNQGRDKIDRYVVDTEADNVTRLVQRMHAAPDELSFVHLAHPDRAGHEHGFMSARYLQAVRSADAQVGRIMRSIRSTAALRQHTALILTADHGGVSGSHDHSNAAHVSNYTVPFMVWGASIAKGADLYAVNDGMRRRPGTTRPTYAGQQPIRNGEVANLVTDLLDLPAVPGSTFNSGHGLRVR